MCIGAMRSCVGLLHVRRLPCLNTLYRRQPEVPLFTLRHRRRRLAIEAFLLDPDAESGPGSAAALCGGPPKAASHLDF